MALGIQGTPTFLINGEFLVGALPAIAFEAAFERAGLGFE
jgi:protein-disulfide isomerase